MKDPAPTTTTDRAASSRDLFLARAAANYACAELTLVFSRWHPPDGSTRARLVFGVVELLHPGLEAGPERSTEDGGHARFQAGDLELDAKRVHMTPSDAVHWYLDCAEGVPTLPLTERERSNGAPLVSLDLPMLGEEPLFPNIVFEEDEAFWSDSAFWGARPGGTRRHQLVPIGPSPAFREWHPLSAAGAGDWLNDVLSFDFSERPRLLGSVHLVLTNPLFGDVHVRQDAEDRRRVWVRLGRWPGVNLPKLKAYARDDRPNGPASVREVDIERHAFSIDLPQEPHRFSFVIVGEEDGLLFASPPATFVHAIEFQMGLMGRERHVVVPAAGDRPTEEYSVRVAAYETHRIGEPERRDAIASLVGDLVDMRERAEALRLGQRWLARNESAAATFVRDLMSRSARDILIVDRCFGALELQRFARISLPRPAARHAV